MVYLLHVVRPGHGVAGKNKLDVLDQVNVAIVGGNQRDAVHGEERRTRVSYAT